MSYSDRLRDPRWQKKRLEILERDEWMCQSCFDSESTLHVHHRRYLQDVEPWDYPANLLLTLCESCHQQEKDDRPGYEEDLLNVLRERFLADDIQRLFEGFQRLVLLHSHEVVATAYSDALRSPKLQQELLNHVFDKVNG